MADAAPSEPTAEELAVAIAKAEKAGAAGAVKALQAKLDAKIQGLPAPKTDKKPIVGDTVLGTAKDVGLSLLSGLGKGVVGLPGLPADLLSFPAHAADLIESARTGDSPTAVRARNDARATLPTSALEPIGSKAFQTYAENNPVAPFKFYEPRTALGDVAQAGAEAVPGGFVGPGGAKSLAGLPRSATGVAGDVGSIRSLGPAARLATYQGAVPGLAAEAVGQTFERMPGFEKWAPLARMGTGVATGVTGGVLSERMPPINRALEPHLRNIPPSRFAEADALLERARARGIELPAALAVDQVSGGGTTLPSLLATAEAHPGSSVPSRLAGMPPQIRRAIGDQIDQVSPTAALPGDIDRRLQQMLPEIAEASPSGQALTAEIAGQRDVTPRQAGTAAQQQLIQQADQIRAARRTQAQQDYGNAYAQVTQVDVAPVLQQLDRAIDVAKGGPETALARARDTLHRDVNGQPVPETRIEALHNSRMAIDDAISDAQQSGAGNTVRLLEEVRTNLNRELTAIPGFRQADANYRQFSDQLRPYEQRGIGAVTEIDPAATGRPPVLPASLVPERLGSAGDSQAAGQLLAPGSPGRAAMVDHMVTQALDAAGRRRGGRISQIDADAIRAKLNSGEMRDLITDFPEVGQRLERLANLRTTFGEQGLPPRLQALANSDRPNVQNAFETLFVRNPLEGNAQEVRQAFQLLAGNDPVATRHLQRLFLRQQLDTASRATQGGSEAMVGAKFFQNVAGNPEQARSLLAAIEVVAGPDAARGMEHLLPILQATGRRQGTGSPTAPRTQVYEDISSPGVIGEVAGAAATAAAGAPNAGAARAISAVNSARGRRLRDATMEQIAEILTSPAGTAQLRMIQRAGGVRTLWLRRSSAWAFWRRVRKRGSANPCGLRSAHVRNSPMRISRERETRNVTAQPRNRPATSMPPGPIDMGSSGKFVETVTHAYKQYATIALWITTHNQNIEAPQKPLVWHPPRAAVNLGGVI